MSRYLVDQVEAHPAIDIQLAAQVRELHGDGSLQAVTIDGGRGRIAAKALSCSSAPTPARTGWAGRWQPMSTDSS